MPDNTSPPPPPVSSSFFTSKPFVILVVTAIALCGGMVFFKSLSEKTVLSFTFTLDGASLPASQASEVKVDGLPFESGGKISMGRHAITVQVKNAEPFEKHFWVLLGAKNLGSLPLETSKGSLTVTVNPSPAAVTLQSEGKSVREGDAPLRIDKLPVGDYMLAIRRGDYKESHSVKIQRNQKTEAKIDLKLGTVVLSALPTNAEFEMSGMNRTWRGNLPIEINDVPSGDYTVVVGRGEYKETHQITVQQLQRTETKVELNLGSAELSAEPADAEFELSGDSRHWQGKLPSHIDDIPVGMYSLLVRRKGWDLTTDISIVRGISTTNKMQFPYGSITITSVPENIAISTNGVEIGKTPVVLGELKPANYALIATDGENDLKEEIAVGPKESAKHAFVFHYGTVQLSSKPTGATIVRKGKEIGKTPLILSHIPVGETMVELRLPDYVSTNFTIKTIEGVTNQLSAQLVSERYLQAMRQAREAFGASQLDQAQKSLDAALVIQPDDSAALQLRGEVAKAVAEIEKAKAEAAEAARVKKANAIAETMASLPWLDFKAVISDCTDSKQVPHTTTMSDGYYDNRGKWHETGQHTESTIATEQEFNFSTFARKYQGKTFRFNCPDKWTVSKVEKDGSVIFKGERSGNLGLIFHTISASPPANNRDAFNSVQKGQKITIMGVISKYTSGFIGPTIYLENAEILTQ